MSVTETEPTGDVPLEARRLPRSFGSLMILLAVILGLGSLYEGFTDYFRFRAWSARRAAWHQRCDFPRQPTFATLDAYARSRAWCTQELDALTADARRNGWALPASPPPTPAR